MEKRNMKATLVFDELSSPLGTLVIAATDSGIVSIHFPGQTHAPTGAEA